jgi:hypothetical protein
MQKEQYEAIEKGPKTAPPNSQQPKNEIKLK